MTIHGLPQQSMSAAIPGERLSCSATELLPRRCCVHKLGRVHESSAYVFCLLCSYEASLDMQRLTCPPPLPRPLPCLRSQELPVALLLHSSESQLRCVDSKSQLFESTKPNNRWLPLKSSSASISAVVPFLCYRLCSPCSQRHFVHALLVARTTCTSIAAVVLRALHVASTSLVAHAVA